MRVILKIDLRRPGLRVEAVLAHAASFAPVETETVALAECLGRVLAGDVFSDVDIPDFNRSTMDGYAVRAASTFGASEANPAYLHVCGQIHMGERPAFTVHPGEAARIATTPSMYSSTAFRPIPTWNG